MTTRENVVKVVGADGEQRALIVNALMEKARRDLDSADAVAAGGDAIAASVASALRGQAREAERLAEMFE
jgi:hypothetical protein